MKLPMGRQDGCKRACYRGSRQRAAVLVTRIVEPHCNLGKLSIILFASSSRKCTVYPIQVDEHSKLIPKSRTC